MEVLIWISLFSTAVAIFRIIYLERKVKSLDYDIENILTVLDKNCEILEKIASKL